jgi:hypothetical protein
MPTSVVPIFRIFDYKKATEFYVDWLGFKIDWEHTLAMIHRSICKFPVMVLFYIYQNIMVIAHPVRKPTLLLVMQELFIKRFALKIISTIILESK